MIRRLAAGAGFAAALVAAGCASPPPPPPAAKAALFAVVPGADGHVGAIVVERGDDKRVIDTAYGAQRVMPDGSVRAETMNAAQVREAFGATLDALPGRPTSFMLYFLEGRDELTVESRSELDKVFGELRKRPLPDIIVIGHTDTVGGHPQNDRLSLARAERMRDMMVSMGIPADRIQATARGKRELLVPTDENIAEPRNRRVEISVR